MAQEPVGYSGLYPNTQTAWRVVNQNGLQVQITQSDVAQGWNDFYTKGVRYQPTPLNIEANQAGSPMGDFFYCGDNNGEPILFYQPIWERDLGPTGLIRQLGANSIAVYNTFNVPTFTMSNSDGTGTVESSASTAEESLINWTALGPVQYEGNIPSSMPSGIAEKQAPPYWYHYNHDVFLDICWNDGNNPVYVWLAVGMSNSVVFSANSAPADGYQYTQWQTYFLNSAQWLATAYANHPAVIGFIITNETNSNITSPYLEYWDFINQLNTVLKTAAPSKLTMVAMQDDTASLTTQLIQYITPPVLGDQPPATEPLYLQSDGSTVGPTVTPNPAYPKHVYAGDVWGWNLYAVPNTSTPSVAYFMEQIGTAYQKPVIVTETGVPGALRYPQVAGVSYGPQGGNDPYFVNPNGYVATWNGNTMTIGLYTQTYPALGIESPPIQDTTSSLRSSGSYLQANPQFNGGGLIVYETDTEQYWLLQQGSTSTQSALWTQLTNSNYLPLLENWRSNQYTTPGAALALWAGIIAMNQFQVGNTTVLATQQIYNGVMAFEHSDEWFKWVDPTIANTPADTTAAGVHDFRDTAITPWGPADAQFYTTWEEEWFGLCSVMPTGRSSTDPAINQYGWLNGGPDTLTPRALFYAVQNAFATYEIDGAVESIQPIEGETIQVTINSSATGGVSPAGQTGPLDNFFYCPGNLTSKQLETLITAHNNGNNVRIEFNTWYGERQVMRVNLNAS